jgi:hypothetical protein
MYGLGLDGYVLRLTNTVAFLPVRLCDKCPSVARRHRCTAWSYTCTHLTKLCAVYPHQPNRSPLQSILRQRQPADKDIISILRAL